VGSRSILLVDDNARIRQVTRKIFEAVGWEVSGEAVNGQDAIDQVNKRRPDIILMDLAMPEMG
jgi:CheY-like chemotaxis protein